MRLIVATHNAGKLAEMRRVLSSDELDIVSQGELGIPPVAETGLTFVENALIKARHAARAGAGAALGDDSGLEVDALDGAPGIYSARFAGTGAGDEDNLRLLLRRLADTPVQRRSARFQCVIVVLRHAADPTPLIFQGTWEGHIVGAPRGSGGFGYDPVFEPLGSGQTAAEMTADQKNRVSHRGQALRHVVQALGRGAAQP